MLTFAAILDSSDDADILPASIEQLRHIGVGPVTVLDHGSTDGTLEYLAEAEASGDTWLVRPSLDDPGADGVARLRLALAAASDADWVLLAAAGELWLPASGALRDQDGLDEEDILVVPRYLVPVTPNGSMLPSRAIAEAYDQTYLYCQPLTDIQARLEERPMTAWTSGLLAPTVMMRPAAVARHVAASARVDDPRPDLHRTVARDLVIAYAPYGTFEQFAPRAARVFRAMTVGHDPKVPVTRERAMDDPAPCGGLGTREDYERQLLTGGQLEAVRRRHVVRSVAELFERPLPSFSTEDAYMDAVQAAEPWLSAAARVCRLEGIRPMGQLIHVATFNRPSVIMPPDHMVKFYSRWRDGSAVVEREIAAYRLLSRDPQVPMPRLVGHGMLDEEWRYLVVEWLPGQPLSAVSGGLGPQAKTRVATWLGRFVRQLHALPLTQAEREQGCRAFREEIRWRYANARARTSGGGLPPRLASQVFDWLPPLDSMLPEPQDVVLTHADLKDDHVLGRHALDWFAPTSVIDYGEARVGHPMYDLPVIWWSALGKDRDLVTTFLRHADIPGVHEEGFPSLALAWAMVHPSWDAVTLTDAQDAQDLDDLAVRHFGGRSVEAPAPLEQGPDPIDVASAGGPDPGSIDVSSPGGEGSSPGDA